MDIVIFILVCSKKYWNQDWYTDSGDIFKVNLQGKQELSVGINAFARDTVYHCDLLTTNT